MLSHFHAYVGLLPQHLPQQIASVTPISVVLATRLRDVTASKLIPCPNGFLAVQPFEHQNR